MKSLSPKEIISKHICGIAGIRIPFAKIIVENILHDLREEGYSIVDEEPNGNKGGQS